MCLPNILSPVPFMQVRFYFSLPLIFTLLAASIVDGDKNMRLLAFAFTIVFVWTGSKLST